MPDVCFRVVDLETVGFLDECPPEIQADPCLGVVELGWTDVIVAIRPDNSIGGVMVDGVYGKLLFNPPGGIPPVSSGVHHITPKMVAGLPPCTPKDCAALAISPPAAGELVPFALVAHNAAFEQEWLSKYLPAEQRWICTLKVAAQLYPDWPSHANQACRYLLGLELDDAIAAPPHRAGPDSYVTAQLLARFLKTAAVRQMVEWTRLPRMMTTCPIGEHRGKPWSAVPADFLRWMLDKAKSMDDDAKYWARKELDNRARFAAQPDLASSEY
jgi:exodeoxyribonuclease X